MQTVSIGIIGFNEVYGIEKLLESFPPQTLLKCAYDIEIVVVSNGSTDNMADIAKNKLVAIENLGVRTKVVELALADKCAAWNHFVHEVANTANYYILLDADVVLVNESGLEELINILIQHPECRLCGGKIVNPKGEIIPRLLDGKCYAARGEFIQNVAIPNGIVLDDAHVVETVVTNWYETDFETGLNQGYIRQAENITVSAGNTPRDNNKSYWIACRKRTVISEYTHRQLDYCMRHIFGGGQQAKQIYMDLFRTNPDWFLFYLNKINQVDRLPSFLPPKIKSIFAVKDMLQYLIYCYCYLLSVKGIRDREFGHLAWKLKSHFW